MFLRHHNRSPDCENYIRWLFLFCNQNIAIVWLGEAKGKVGWWGSEYWEGVWGVWRIWMVGCRGRGENMGGKCWSNEWCGKGEKGKGDTKSGRREKRLKQKWDVMLRTSMFMQPRGESWDIGRRRMFYWVKTSPLRVVRKARWGVNGRESRLVEW